MIDDRGERRRAVDRDGDGRCRESVTRFAAQRGQWEHAEQARATRNDDELVRCADGNDAIVGAALVVCARFDKSKRTINRNQRDIRGRTSAALQENVLNLGLKRILVAVRARLQSSIVPQTLSKKMFF